MQAFLEAVVVNEARRSANAALLARFSDRSDGTRLTPADAVTAAEEARSERDAHLAELFPTDNRPT
jgi:hypothetical protein